MKPRATIFDSVSERELFESIAGSWEPNFRLFPHVPFTNLVDLNPQSLDSAELSFLHKTTVDYALTSEQFAPMLGIEFDGLGHGYSKDGQYVAVRAVRKDPQRDWKLALKCRVAQAAGFPFVVVSYDEKAIIDEDTGLTVAHGIVGAFVAGKQLARQIPELTEDLKARNPDMTADEFVEEMQDAILAAELDADIEYNPIVKREIELEGELYRRFPTARLSWSYVEDPERPSNTHPWLPSFDQAAWQKWWDSIQRLVVEVTIGIDQQKTVTKTWIRNYEGAGLTPFGWLDELAKLVAIRSFLNKNERVAPAT